MSDTTIRPAMDEQAWYDLLRGEPAVSRLDAAVVEACHAADLTQHALAAACLHGQPFGFTWDDVDLLREASTLAQWRAFTPIADRIAALLPPRESGTP
jgi:hypothetical protein